MPRSHLLGGRSRRDASKGLAMDRQDHSVGQGWAASSSSLASLRYKERRAPNGSRSLARAKINATDIRLQCITRRPPFCFLALGHLFYDSWSLVDPRLDHSPTSFVSSVSLHTLFP
ncbi:hypothetical protein MTO96_005790 [Rhipicephalus appendiculatus]